ncbi:Glycerophosphodiester phosphodiesterase GDPD4 [Abeliophyllum distichum]|uniref:glycerophosphodiester phosphodiesterase n=1 Tax=Abeliophyllum distichum TaxID=126358 RepID=A0ABD1TLU1_9LAMI
MMMSRWNRQQRQLRLPRHGLIARAARNLGLRGGLRSFTSRRKLFRFLLVGLAIITILPPLYFHFKLRRFYQMQSQKCSWMRNPPLVCAHGGDSSNAFPNTMDAYNIALGAQVDCIEIDVSRSSDGVLFALHDRDLQRLSGNSTSKVGFLSMNEITELDSNNQRPLQFHNVNIPTIEDALRLVSGSVQRVILDAKVGPPSYEKGLAKDILSVVEKTECKNCLIWAKSDSLARDVIKLSSDVTVGYIVMIDPTSGTRTNLLRMKSAGVVGVYHPLIDEKLVKILHGRNKKVYAWTVDEEDAMQKMLFEHVDAVVTSNPTLLQRLMQDMRTQCLEEGFSL